MQSNTPKEPIPPSGRERPLQKSMFLQSYQHQNTSSHNLNNEHPPVHNPMKRSLMENIHNSSGSTNNQYQFRTQTGNNNLHNSFQHPNTHSGNNQNFMHEPRQGNNQRGTDFIHHSNSSHNLKHALNMNRTDTPQEEHKQLKFDKPQHKPPLKPKTPDLPQDTQTLINEVVALIKEKHLPPLLNLVKKQIYDEIHTLKQEFMNFRDQMRAHKNHQEHVNQELKHNKRGKSTHRQSRESRETRESRQTKDSDLNELQKDYFLLQGKIKQLQSKISEGLDKVYHRLDDQGHGYSHGDKSFKSSAVKSSLTPIMLQYREIFAVKGGSRPSSQEQIPLSTCQYYVDKSGYLLDSENRYLIDRKGSQIRLEERHLKLLQKHKILYK